MDKLHHFVENLRQNIANIFRVPVEMLKTAHKVKHARAGAYINYNQHGGPLCGRELDHYAWEWIGINRQPGETDEELRRRCIDTINKAYEGTLVVPHDDLREYMEAAINKEKQGVRRNE